MSCPFCNPQERLVLKKTQNVVVLANLYPGVEYHLLVVPLEHARSVTQLPPEVVGEMFIEAVAAAKVLEGTLSLEGMNILLNEGAVAGQTADHVHLHVIPRKTDDNYVNMSRRDPTRTSVSESALLTLKTAFSD